MLKDTGIGRGLNVKQIATIVVIFICILTMVLPWVYLGLRTESGSTWDLEKILDEFEGLSINELADEILDDLGFLDDFLFEDELPRNAVKSLRSVKKAVTNMVKAVRDSRLSPVEMASICSQLGKIQGALLESDKEENLGFSKAGFVLIAIIQWVLILSFAGMGVCCIYAELKGKKAPLIGAMCIYLLIFLLYAIITVYVNLQIKEAFGSGFLLSLAGIKSTSILHIRFAPILGSIMLIANFVFQKRDTSATLGAVGAGIGDISKKMMWKCECGATNTAASKFCPKCGKGRPADFTPADFKADVVDKLVWTCSCGNTNPKKNAFCSKCGAKQSIVSTGSKLKKPTHSAVAYYCKGCGKPVKPGVTLCDECSMAAVAARRIKEPAPRVESADETIAERKAVAAASSSRIKKNFKPPTTLD